MVAYDRSYNNLQCILLRSRGKSSKVSEERNDKCLSDEN